MSNQSSALETVPEYKLRFPREGERIPRQQLFDYLGTRDDRMLIAVHGRAGQGKTTFVADYLRLKGARFSWYTVDSWDTSPLRLVSGLLSSLSGGLSGGQEDVRVDPERIETDFIQLVSKIVGEDHYLVVDDLHALDPEGEVCSFLQRVIFQIPPKLHLVLISRRQFSIELARLRSLKELVEIDDEDLAFSEGEVKLFLQNIARVPLPGGLFDKLFHMIGGWITGYVYLSERIDGLTEEERENYLGDFIKTGMLPEIEDFFREEVITNLSEKEVETAIELGSVKQPCEELVSLITGEEPAGFFQKLLRNHSFISCVDAKQGKYSFDELLYRYLEKQFQLLDRRKKAKTVKLVSEYLEKRKNYKRLVWYLLSVSEPERARDYFVKYADELYKKLGQEKLRTMLESFPDTMRENEQCLSYYYALSTNLVRPMTTSKELLGMIPSFRKSRAYEKIGTIYSVLLINSLFYQRSREAIKDIVSQADEFLAEHGEQIENEQKEILESVIPLGKWKVGHDENLAFRMALQAEETSYKFHNQEAYLCARLVLSRVYLEKGEFVEAKRILQRTENFLEAHSVNNLFRLLIAFYLGDTYFYLGEIGNAVEWIEQALKQCPDDFAYRYYLELNLIIYNLYLEDIKKADSLFEFAESRETDEILLIKYYSRYLIRMLISYRSKDVGRMEYFADRLLETENESLLRTDFPYSYLALTEVLIVLGRCEDAMKVLSPLQTDSFRKDHPYPGASAMALTALCREQQGDSEGMREAIRNMLEIIRTHNYRNLDIVDPELLNHLADLAKEPIFSEFPRLASRRAKTAVAGGDYDLVIKTLGSFRVYIRGKEITTSLLSTQKRVMDLLKLLIVHRKNGVMKEKIYEIFWPRYSYKSVRDNLNTIIYRLRKIFGSDANFLVTDVNMIYFKEGKISIDIDDFVEYYDRARSAEKQGNLKAAISLYRMADEVYDGDFLSGDLYFDFIRDQREELKNKYRQVLFSLTQISLSAGKYGHAIDWSKKLIAADKLCEPAYRLLMIASALSGNRSVIPKFFETLEHRLTEAYNLSADERTKALKDRLLYGLPIDSSFWDEERLI